MVDQLSSFADEVTRVAREVGTEGKLGGQAQVKGVAGTWRDLTEQVNQLASTLTTQLRTIAKVSTAVASGDLTQQVRVAARGEVADLKDNINQMIVALRETTGKNTAQVWLDSNLARVGALLQGQRDLTAVCQLLMNEVAPLVEAQVGAFYLAEEPDADPPVEGAGEWDRRRWRLRGGYALDDGVAESFRAGQGLVGQAAATQQTILVEGLPPTEDLNIRTGVRSAAPSAVVIVPVMFENEPLGVMEFASVKPFDELHLSLLDRLAGTIGVTLGTIRANRRTEVLLTESQRLTRELQEQSATLQHTNAELHDKAALLSEQNRKIEIKNKEIDAARRGVEEQAQKLALTSRYKSEFLANMSHELRTPLNSMLLLSRLLSEDADNNLTDKQREFAATIHHAGTDLLVLIDDILDLSKVEAGRVQVQAHETDLVAVRDELLRAFGPHAEDKQLTLRVELGPDLPEPFVTDPHRLHQILRNLLSNALKFTSAGEVGLHIHTATNPDGYEMFSLDQAETVVAFVVTDTGIGIPGDKLEMIFDAFAQADGTTSRAYGGTGLGLSISRELARLLGGTITVRSTPNEGSVFTLLLPDQLPPPAPAVAPSRRSPRARETTRSDGTVDTVGAVAPANTPPLLGTPRPPAAAPTSIRRRARAELSGARVLIVDDDVRNGFALTSALETQGLVVFYAENGADALDALSTQPDIDIVLMDAMMPDMDGQQTTAAVRRLPHGHELPIVFLTAKAAPEDRTAALAVGATDYLTKPVDLDDLLDSMVRALHQRPRARPRGAH
jgi:signal transduction histidine kinase/CheY-like chemotaxis protein/HAMP domain-containing protein